MKVLIIGQGGREHTLAWKIKQSPMVEKIYCAPGNAGTSELGTNVSIPSDDLQSLKKFAQEEKIDLTVVGPEKPLVDGIVDLFRSAGLRIFGPSQKAAQIEGSKIWAKELMKKYHIPSAQYEIFDQKPAALKYIKNLDYPIVIKADGLAAGKGVIIVSNYEQAEQTLTQILEEKIFGSAGQWVIVEEYLTGEEVSILAFSDGENILPLIPSQDHKKAFDHDQGPNTGGMGAYAPVPFVKADLQQEIEDKILKPTISALSEEGCVYQGILYAGLMLTKAGPYVLEFNCRFGDPETQAVLPLMDTELVEVILASLQGKLPEIEMSWQKKSAVCVVLSSGGYPGSYEKGKEIKGLDELRGEIAVYVFHAGTRKNGPQILTNGGRVLGIVGLGEDVKRAAYRTYQAISKIHFEKMHYRKDIGWKALNPKSEILTRSK
jgi:phosphoribosylamine--glycine ligase